MNKSKKKKSTDGCTLCAVCALLFDGVVDLGDGIFFFSDTVLYPYVCDCCGWTEFDSAKKNYNLWQKFTTCHTAWIVISCNIIATCKRSATCVAI